MDLGIERIGVIGAGIVGLAVARRLGQVYQGAQITVVDKETSVGAHQTGHNSGVVHAGIYYTPDSLKAMLCTRGSELLREYCQNRGIAFQECGKLVVAIDESEVGALGRIEERATKNQVPGLRRVDAAEIREIEPHAVGVAALHSPRTAITDYPAIARAYADDVHAAGASCSDRRSNLLCVSPDRYAYESDSRNSSSIDS
jgi:L-2-hydroxyglutarate oxidase